MKKEFDSTKPSYSNRDDSGSHDTRSSSPFARDKRPRIKRVENAKTPGDFVPPRPRTDNSSPFEGKRKSFNPNFDKDNHRKDSSKIPYSDRRSSDESGTGDRPERSGNSYSSRTSNSGSGNSYSSRTGSTGGYNKDKNSRFSGDKRQFGDKRTGGKRPFGDKKKKFAPRTNTPNGGFDSDYKPEKYPTFDAAPIKEPIRLNRFISMSGVCSRREADQFITQGLVTVNGEVVTELGVKVSPTDQICYNDAPLQGEKKVYILMNKPKGFVTTVEDPNAERTVMDIVKNACKERVYPVGRLDKNSLGVLLITNDGELTKKLTHPSFQKKKVYQVSLDKAIPLADLQKMCDGVELEDGVSVVDEANYVGITKREVGVTIHSGRNRVVRRMFEYMGYSVQKLDRVYFAGLTKKGLRRGAWRYLTTAEVAMLKSGKYD